MRAREDYPCETVREQLSKTGILFVETDQLPERVLCIGIKNKDGTIMAIRRHEDG